MAPASAAHATSGRYRAFPNIQQSLAQQIYCRFTKAALISFATAVFPAVVRCGPPPLNAAQLGASNFGATKTRFGNFVAAAASAASSSGGIDDGLVRRRRGGAEHVPRASNDRHEIDPLQGRSTSP